MRMKKKWLARKTQRTEDSMAPLKIGLYVGSWPQNIGNAFFDLGAKAILQAAFPDALFYPLGGAVHWMFNASSLHNKEKSVTNLGAKILRKTGVTAPYGNNHNSLELGQFAEVDVLVFAGMSMCREFAENNGRTFIEASKRGVAVLGLGAGASLYTKEDASSFAHFFSQLPNAAIITRDDDTYGMFDGTIARMEKGMDCAFCLPDFYTPPRLALPAYNIENFDDASTDTAQIAAIEHQGRIVIHTHHDLWGPLCSRYISKPNTLISDIPEDYLTLYSQVAETYSDRVHACVASLAYGNKARLFSKTPRKALFQKMGLQNITTSVVSLNQDLREEMKSKQIETTKRMITDMLS